MIFSYKAMSNMFFYISASYFLSFYVCHVDMKPDCNENMVWSRHIPWYGVP